MQDILIKKLIKKKDNSRYKINDKIYEKTYDLDLMDQQILYELNTSEPVQVKNNTDININNFLNTILFNRIDMLFNFLYYMKNKYINKLKFYLCFYYCKKIKGIGINRNKVNLINQFCKLIYKKFTILEFVYIFGVNDFKIILYEYSKKLNYK